MAIAAPALDPHWQAMADTPGAIWPLAGLLHFLSHPGLWLRALVGTAALLALTVAAAGAALWLSWPSAEGFWAMTGAVLLSITWTLVAASLAWYAAGPFIMGWAFERVAAQVLKTRGAPTPGEGIAASVRSAGTVLLRTLHWRVGWPLCALALGFIPGLNLLAPLVAAFGLAHVGALDGGDLALALRGVPGQERLALLRAHRGQLLAGCLLAALMVLGLGFTVVGGLLIAPMLYTGAALWVVGWPRPAVHPDR